jgi:sterol desaturase/sphingolipid hydroxylase (fatty acid hydroxylase superfamily)
MAIRSAREFRFVLIPPYGIVAAFFSALPIPGALALLGQWNLALLFMATGMGYVVSYEWLHLAYHLPVDSFFGRLKLVAMLRRHHATHHDPELMQKWNFNVTVPLWDLVRGTIYKASSESEQAGLRSGHQV